MARDHPLQSRQGRLQVTRPVLQNGPVPFPDAKGGVGGLGKAGQDTVKRVMIRVKKVEPLDNTRIFLGQEWKVVLILDHVVTVKIVDEMAAIAGQPRRKSLRIGGAVQ